MFPNIGPTILAGEFPQDLFGTIRALLINR